MEVAWLTMNVDKATIRLANLDPPMTEPTLTCPQCGTEIKLTESLAAPLIQVTRQEFEARAKEAGVVLYVRAVPSINAGETIVSVGVVAATPP